MRPKTAVAAKVPWVNVAVIGMALLAPVLGHGDATDPSQVTVTIAPYMAIAADDITAWSQGTDGDGNPMPGTNGADPLFSGGTLGDIWDHDNVIPYCKGAVGRSVLTVDANQKCRVRIFPTTSQLKDLSDGAGHVLHGYVGIGWIDPGPPWVFTDVQRAFLTPPGHDDTSWLYFMAQRKGLADPAGTYSAVISLDGYTW